MDSLRPEGKEILISDAFEWITSTVHVRGVVLLEVPLYDNNDPYEKILIKTNEGVISDPSAIIGGPTTLNEASLSACEHFKLHDTQMDTKGNLHQFFFGFSACRGSTMEVKNKFGHHKNKILYSHNYP